MTDLPARLKALEARIEVLEQHVALALPSVEHALRRRGLRSVVPGDLRRVILPAHGDPRTLDRYYHDLWRYHFRRLLQEAVERQALDTGALQALRARWGAAADRYLERLARYRLLEPHGEGWRFVRPEVRTFGETLEWFVAEVFRREFAAPALWDVRVRGLRPGGDYDVVVLLDQRLGYVECKSSPPHNISAANLEQFVQRLRRLRPDVGLLLIDTTLRIERNILDNLRWLLAPGRKESVTFMRVTDGVFRAEGSSPPLFVLTGRRSLVVNLHRAVRTLYGL